MAKTLSAIPTMVVHDLVCRRAMMLVIYLIIVSWIARSNDQRRTGHEGRRRRIRRDGRQAWDDGLDSVEQPMATNLKRTPERFNPPRQRSAQVPGCAQSASGAGPFSQMASRDLYRLHGETSEIPGFSPAICPPSTPTSFSPGY